MIRVIFVVAPQDNSRFGIVNDSTIDSFEKQMLELSK